MITKCYRVWTEAKTTDQMQGEMIVLVDAINKQHARKQVEKGWPAERVMRVEVLK